MSNTRSSNSQDLTPQAFSFDANGNLVINKQDLDPNILAKLNTTNTASVQPGTGQGAAAPHIITVGVSAII